MGIFECNKCLGIVNAKSKGAAISFIGCHCERSVEIP